jgi:tetratricopeptide (TPR) repeat protein
MRAIALLSAAALLSIVSATQTALAKADKNQKIPITTTSDEARALFLEGRALQEKLQIAEAHAKFEAALAKDPSFALAQLNAAQTAQSAQQFFDGVKRAVELAPKASPGERMLIELSDAGARGDTARQTELVKKIVAAFPGDERAHNLLGGQHFGRQQWKEAIAAYKKATAIDASYSAPYNQLGYALRFLGRYDEAEQAFKKYIELIPNDPNPYDSYGELLMKTGRFDESIKQYEKALSVDKSFIASYVGIANNQMFMNKPEDARKTLAQMSAVARNDGERRQAMFWTAQTYLDEGATDKALAEMEKMAALDEKNKDMPNLSGANFLMGEMLIEAGRADEALARFTKQHQTMLSANVPQGAKDQADRNMLYNEAKVAIAKGDLAKAKANAAKREKLVQVNKVLFEVQQIHELRGRIALAEKNHAVAAAELAQANQQDARVQFLLAQARQGKGDAKGAKEALTRAAEHNALGGNYAFVRRKAKDMLARS